MVVHRNYSRYREYHDSELSGSGLDGLKEKKSRSKNYRPLVAEGYAHNSSNHRCVRLMTFWRKHKYDWRKAGEPDYWNIFDYSNELPVVLDFSEPVEDIDFKVLTYSIEVDRVRRWMFVSIEGYKWREEY